MSRYIIRRLIQMVITALLTSVFLFIMLNLMRGDAIDIYFGAEKLRTPEAEARLRTELGLDKPLHTQYLLWLGKAVRGDLGVSWRFQVPVMKMFQERILLTSELWGLASLISIAGSVTLGIYLAVHQNSVADQVIRFAGLVALSAPIYWVAIITIVLLARIAHWIPPVIYQSFRQNPVQHLEIITIPIILWGTLSIPSFSRYVRNSVLDVLSADYVRTARAKGLPERRVLLVHALRNAAGPLVTIVGLSAGGAAGGTVLLESVFSLPGMGRLFLAGISQRDYPVVMGLSLMVSLIFLGILLVSDLSYALFDPRIRYD